MWLSLVGAEPPTPPFFPTHFLELWVQLQKAVEIGFCGPLVEAIHSTEHSLLVAEGLGGGGRRSGQTQEQ